MTITREMLNQHNQEKRAMSPDHFPRERAGYGNETSIAQKRPRILRSGEVGCGGRSFDVALSFQYLKKKQRKSGMSGICPDRLAWPTGSSRG